MSEIPYLVEGGYFASVDVGSGHVVLFYRDGQNVTARFQHRCDRGARGVVICAPLLQVPHGHQVVSRDPLTISPSILCTDCGTHGFVTNGVWGDA